ncbi:hypothetical protein A5641_07310 [Mycobacterium sp. 1554424.7]|nr:hypothetical protein A5641_07310 [Mycobacterium sp. 1554424.7]
MLELTAGFGPPCEGDELKQSSRQFAALSGQLMVALPDDGWQGGAAQVYAEADITLGTIAQRMAELDGQVGALIHDQADWVTHIRLGFGILKDLLLAAFFAWTAMMATSNPTAARVFANTVCALGISIAVGMLVTLGYYSYENGQQADGLAGQYGQLAQEPVSGGAVVQAKVAAPAEESSVVSSFEGDSAGMAMTSATSEGSAAASGSDGSADQRAAVGGVRGAGQAAVEDVAAVAPTVSMPTLAEVSAWSGRAATVSGHASQHVNLVNQTMGSVQQRHIREPAGPAGASPAEETAGDGAGVGTQTGQRAPLEVAALDIRDTPDPHPLGRLA